MWDSRPAGAVLKEPLAQEHSDVLRRFLAEPCEQTFAAVFESLYTRVRRFFFARGYGRDADELAQDVLFSVYRHVHELRDAALFYGWLFRIARNRLHHHVQQKGEHHDADFAPFEEASAAGVACDPLQDYSFRRLLSHVDPEARQILTMRFVDELGYDDIGYALGIPSGTVKWKVFQAKNQLRALITKGNR